LHTVAPLQIRVNPREEKPLEKLVIIDANTGISATVELEKARKSHAAELLNSLFSQHFRQNHHITYG